MIRAGEVALTSPALLALIHFLHLVIAMEELREEGQDGCAIEAVRQDMRMVRHAVAKGWPVSDRIKGAVMGLVEEVLGSDDQPVRTKLSAAKVALAADLVNVKLLGIASGERNTDVRAQVDALREALRSQDVRDALAHLTATTQPYVDNPPLKEEPPASDEAIPLS